MLLKWQFLSLTVENAVGKGENASYQHFLLFPLCFPKAYSVGSGLCGRVKRMKEMDEGNGCCFSGSHSNSKIRPHVYCRLTLDLCQLLTFGLNPFPNKPWFYMSAVQVF